MTTPLSCTGNSTCYLIGEAMKKALLIASTGGHLEQLFRLAPLYGVAEDSVWVTFRTEQSESLLDGRRAFFVPYVAPRGVAKAAVAARRVYGLLKREHFDLALSTGAALAVSALPLARLHGLETHYVESVSRVEGPSLSGRIIAALRCAELHTQHEDWARGRWSKHDSVMEAYRPVRDRPIVLSPKLFVTLGTIAKYRFDALVDSLLASGLADERTVWQVGETARDDLPGQVYRYMPAHMFERLAREADVVVSHSGVGSILNLLDMGVRPVLSSRRSARGEHVDDHQAQIAGLAGRAGVACVVEADALEASHLVSASAWRVERCAKV